MIYLLLVAAACFGLAWYLHQKYTNGRADNDWISELVAGFLFIGGASFAVIYLALAFWNHRFW